METTRYFATSLQAAMETARRELGAEALLVDSRPSPAEMRRLGPLEVTFAWEKKPGGELDDIRQEIAALRATMNRQPPGRVVTPIASNVSAEKIPVAAFPALRNGETRVVAFVGPAGRGKTTSLVKVAVKYGIAQGVPVRIYLAGTHGVGATGQMAKYAGILGVPFQAIEPFEGLSLALQGDQWKGLVLIDTPGLGVGDREEMESMAKFFARREEIERHLVLRADARSADMQLTLSRFAPVRPNRLLFTGLDEVTGLEPVAEMMIRSGIPGAFFGTGTQIPEDLEEVDAVNLARSSGAESRQAARAAA